MATDTTPRTTSIVGSTTPTQFERSDKKGAMGGDAFMKLMLAQMKNQDPMAPTDSAAMMGQLAQFTSVEQLTKLTQGMTELKLGQDFQASVGLIGKTVMYKDATGAEARGTVTSVRNATDGAVLTLDGGKTVTYDKLTQVQ